MPFVRGFVHVAMHRSLVARLACNLGETLRRRGRAMAHRMHASPRRIRAQSMRVRDEEDGELSLAGSSTRRAGTEAGRQGRREERLAATPTKRIRRCGATGQAPAPPPVLGTIVPLWATGPARDSDFSRSARVLEPLLPHAFSPRIISLSPLLSAIPLHRCPLPSPCPCPSTTSLPPSMLATSVRKP